MSEPKFVLPRKKYTGDSTVISMRVPKDMLQDIDMAADHTGRSRNEVLTMAIEFALGHMVFDDKNNTK